MDISYNICSLKNIYYDLFNQREKEFITMSAKNMDKKNRWRNKTIGFRMSEEESQELNMLAKLSGLSKQDYIISRVLERKIIVNPNSRIYKALRNELQNVHEQLENLSELSKLSNSKDDIQDNILNEELIELTMYISNIIADMKG